MNEHSVDTLERDVDEGPRARQRRPRWADSHDPVLVAVAAVALTTYVLHGLQGALSRDLALYSYAGQQVAEGVPPYLGVLNRAGPLAHAIPAIGVWIARSGGFDDVVGMRILFLLLATACTTAVYGLARDLFDRRLAGVTSAAVFLGFHGFIEYASNGPREKTPMTLFVVLALWAVTRRRWFSAGMFVSLATLCLQIAFFPAVATTVVGALLTANSRVVALARVAAGGAVPVAVLTVWFTLAGSLRQSVDAFVLINLRYTVPNPPLEDVDRVVEDTLRAYGTVWTWLFLGGITVLAVGALTSTVPAVRRREPGVVVMAALTAGVASGLWWNLRDYDSWADLFPLLPFAAVGVGALVPALSSHLPGRAPLVVASAASATAVAVSVHWSATTRDDVLEDQRRAVGAVLDELPDGASVTSVEAPQALVLTRTANPTRHQMFRAGLQDYVDDSWPGGLDAFARDLVDRRPTLVALGDTTYDYWREAIGGKYVCVGNAPGWSWWARKSVGGPTITALRDATGYTSPDDCARYAVTTSR